MLKLDCFTLQFQIDPNVVEEFKAENVEEELGKESETSQAPVSRSLVRFPLFFIKLESSFLSLQADTTENLPSSISSDFQTLEVDSTGSGHMSMAKMPSNTSTTNTTVKQMATVQPLQRLVSPPCASSDDKSVTSNRLEISTRGAEKESEDEEEEEGAGEETFDILSAALDASVTPATSEQILQQQPQQQQYVLTTFCVMESGTASAVLEASSNPTIAANPLAASVNDIAQISALTAAISPIQTLPTLSATCIGLPASVTGEGGCSSSTLLVVDRKIEEDDATLVEPLPIESDLEPSSEESPKDSASEGSPRKVSMEEEEATGGESESSLLEVAAELPSQETSKESPLQALIPIDTFHNPAPLKVPFEANQTLIDVATDLPISTKSKGSASVIDEPGFPVVEAFLEASEGDISSKLDTNEVKRSSLNSPPLKESSPQAPVLLQPSDTSASSEMDVESSEVNRDSSVETLADPHGPHPTDTDVLGVRELDLTPVEESAEPSLQMDTDGAPVSMGSLQGSAVEVNSTSSVETPEDLRSSCETGLNAPVVRASDFSVIQKFSKSLVQKASEGMNLKIVEKPILEGGPLEASVSMDPFKNSVHSDKSIGFRVIDGPPSPSEKVEVSRGSAQEIDSQTAIEELSGISSKVNPDGGARSSKETQPYAAEEHRKSATSQVMSVVRGSMDKELLKDGPLQASDSMKVTPHLSDKASQRILEETCVLVENEPGFPIFGESLEAESRSGKSSERALVQAFSAIPPQRIETEVESSDENPLQISDDVEGSGNIFEVSITKVTDCVEPKLIEEPPNNDFHLSDVSSPSKTHISGQLLREEAMDIPTPLEQNPPQDESKRFVSGEESPLEVGKPVDYESAESFKYKATDHMVDDSPANDRISLESQNHPITPTFSSEVRIAGIETIPHATEIREVFGVSMAVGSYLHQYEANEAELASTSEGEEIRTEFCNPPSHSKSTSRDSNHNSQEIDPTSTSDRPFPPPSTE